MYQSNDVAGGQLDARIEVYDGRLWVDRGGGNAEDDEIEGDDVTKSSFNDESTTNERNTKEMRTATVSQLLVDKAQRFHSGRYICSALGTTGTWTQVHILDGTSLSDAYYLLVNKIIAVVVAISGALLKRISFSGNAITFDGIIKFVLLFPTTVYSLMERFRRNCAMSEELCETNVKMAFLIVYAYRSGAFFFYGAVYN